MKKLFILLYIILLVFSCKTIGIQKQQITQVELATIGKEESGITKLTLQTNAIPNLIKKVRVGVMVNHFTKSSFLNYTKALKQLDRHTNLKYVDSLPNKPKYITLTILDKVTLLNNLNNAANNKTFNYLKTASNSKIVTEVALVFPKNTQKALQEADEIYLVQSNYKKYALEVIKDNNKQIINLTKATIFNYKTTSFCWGENNRHEIKIVDISNKCHKNTFKNYQKAKKHKSDFNFIKL